ncbi:MAG: phage tail tape measure protein [Shimia sp.]
MRGDLNVALVLRLVNRIAGPARAAVGDLDRIGRASEEAGRRGMIWANRAAEANAGRRAALQGEVLGIAATGYALAQLVRPAIEFEDAMSGVRKVLDFDTPKGFERLREGVLDLSTVDGLPMRADEIAAIVEAAGQTGVIDAALPDDEERRQLFEFTRDAARMGVAFDLSAQLAGQAMARWRKSGLAPTREDALLLGDAINHLSNNTGATAAGITDIVRRQGALATQYGLSAVEVAGLAGALLESSGSVEISATAMKNFLGPLKAGASATKRESDVFKALGIDAVELAKRMDVDAKGAIIGVLEALSELPDHVRAAAIQDLFGEESIGAIAPLIGNLDLLRNSWALVGEQTDYAGSMGEEYAVAAARTSNALKLTANYVRALQVAIGDALLPMINDLLKDLMPVVGAITEWAKANPALIETLGKVVLALFALRLASIAIRFVSLGAIAPVLQLVRGLSFLATRFGRVAPAVARAVAGLARFRGAWAVVGALAPLRWARLISPVRWAAFLPSISWAAFAARTPKFGMNATGWGRVITPLKWMAKAGLRLIPIIGWAALAAEIGIFAWEYLGLKELPWAQYLADIDWLGWASSATNFAWGLVVRVMDWLAWIGDIDWLGWATTATRFSWSVIGLTLLPWMQYIPAIPWGTWFSFGWADLLPSWDWSAIIPTIDLSDWIRMPGGGEPLPLPAGSSARLDARDGGGAVRPFTLYKINERGEEGFVPHTAGHVVTAAKMAEMRRALAPGAMRPARGAGGEGRSFGRGGIEIGQITINTTGPADARSIARDLKRELRVLDRDEDAALHDGVFYR